MTDRERILTEIVSHLASTQLLADYRRPTWNGEAFQRRDTGGGEYVHFNYKDKPKKGDLVLAKTGGVSEWKVAWYIEPLPGGCGGALVREIGSNRTCKYSNEDFVTIQGLHSSVLLEGEEYEFRNKVLKAFAKGAEYCYRFGGVDFIEENHQARIWVREVFGGMLHPDKARSVPFSVVMPWNKKTSVKAILNALREGGYGTRQFEHQEVQPAITSSETIANSK